MRRSWLDVLVQFVDAVPGPRWVVYGASVVGWLILLHAAAWADGATPVGEFRADVLVSAVIPALFLWSMQLLDGVALRALDRLRPVLELDSPAQAAVAADLTRTPALPAAALGVIGLIGGVLSVLESPESWLVDPENPGLFGLATEASSAATMAVVLGFLGHVVYQLRIVDRVHRDSVRVDLFNLEPLYAFATLTSRTGIVLIGSAVTLTALLSIAVGALILATATDVATALAVFVVGIACFIVPLLGLHDRIADEKARRVNEARATLATVLGEVRGRVQAGDLDGAGRLNDAVAAASGAIGAVSRVSPWPWRTETLRGFVSAVLLPIGLFLVYETLRRILPQ